MTRRHVVSLNVMYRLLVIFFVGLSLQTSAQRLLSIDVGKRSRSYLMEAHHELNSPTLFIVFHAQGGNVVNLYEGRKKWHSLPENTMVLFPNAIAGEWSCQDTTHAGVTPIEEIHFINALIERYVAEYAVNPSQILLVSFPEGKCIAGLFRRSRFYNDLKYYTLDQGEMSQQEALLIFIRRIQALRRYVDRIQTQATQPTHSGAKTKERNGYFRSRVDSMAFFNGEILPGAQLKISTMFTLTIGGGAEFAINRFTSLHVSYGTMFDPYMNLLFDRFESRSTANPEQIAFIRANYAGGRVWTLGTNLHFRKYYVGPFLQSQKFIMKSTSRTFVETLAPDRAQEINDLAIHSPDIVENFYNYSEIKAAVYPVQLGVQLGKRFLFKQVPQLSIATEFGYSFNIDAKGKIDSRNGAIGDFLNNIVGPVINESLEKRFNSIQIPTASLSIIYNISYTGDY
jgi:hypothetical protein